MANQLNKFMLIGLFLSVFFSLSGYSHPAMSAEACPPIIAGLMPQNAVKVSGQYMPTGMMSMGSGAAWLPFENRCANQTTKNPGHVTFEVQHYAGDGIMLFKMQIDGVEKQTLENERKALEKHRPKGKPSPKLEKVNPITTEKVKGGTIMYFDYWTDCSEDFKASKPSAWLVGFAHTDSAQITIHIDGFISQEAARTAAVEILENFSKAKF
jgi:hypothetical protein